ncbi:hypothetical protein [Sinorhizobium sp. CCBAU 05631]|uniref:hypothetical protein n=1 Tax=Sinorhizobium sp. CCBAU 05631 TaxID=794846 RepID=UPI0004B290B0|nr:hypothetical protein [Sinorhizobium sp. CCBAU 05631]ASY58302.1 hypothetical protein SS05631_c33880 [Sinorhizobium sp. CCBAU 05631]
MIWNMLIRKEQVADEADDGEDSNFVTKLAHEPQTHLEQYLAYYVGREEPGYAVLITGDWGTGKTHQVTKALPADHAHYVSLFGLNTPEEIEAQVFAKMFPKMASLKKFADKLGAVNVGVPGYGSLGVNGLTSVLANTLIKDEVDNSKPLIFDDLERCSVRNSKILGIINRYVEHHKCRVIVIAHDTKVVDAFKDAKEKVFGQTLMVEPNVDAAFEEFNTFFAQKNEKDLLGDLKAEVLSIFRESEAQSLRILRHVIEDVRRLVAVLEERHREDRAAMVELIRLFSALAIEYRSNAIQKEDIRNRHGALYAHRLSAAANNGSNVEPPRFVKAAAKYKSINLSGTILQDDVLCEMLVEGRFDPVRIRESVNASAYFLKLDSSPWQIVINFDQLDDDLVNPALERMEEQFEKREVIESGEMLHIFALKMMMAARGLTSETVRQVTDACKAYIDDLLKKGNLPPRTRGSRWFDDFDGAYQGVSYWVTDPYKHEFREVFEHLVEARGKALENKFGELIPALLEVVRSNGLTFFEMVCHTHNGTIVYEDIPILASIAPEDFVDAWLASPKAGWYWIENALKERHMAASHFSALEPETVWVPKVIRILQARAEKEKGLSQLRLIRAIKKVGVAPPPAPEPEAGTEKTGEDVGDGTNGKFQSGLTPSHWTLRST